jgi:small subunit ribosomal protein S14
MRDIKRAKLVKKHAAKREQLKRTVSSPKASYEEKLEAQPPSCRSCRAIRAPPPAQPLRVTGRSRGVYEQVRLGPQQAARSHHARRRAGLAQGQLVKRRDWKFGMTSRSAVESGDSLKASASQIRCSESRIPNPTFRILRFGYRCLKED